jgi:hypothetical protein
MIKTVQAVIRQNNEVQLLNSIEIDTPKRALLIVFDEENEESIFEKSSSYILSEKSLAVHWSKPEEEEAWAYLQ